MMNQYFKMTYQLILQLKMSSNHIKKDKEKSQLAGFEPVASRNESYNATNKLDAPPNYTYTVNTMF